MPFNHTDLPLLPAFSDFQALRKVGELYCDRSVQIAKLAARKPGLLYLGRPRMFGRTFLLTTLKALFKEGAAVFDELAGKGLSSFELTRRPRKLWRAILLKKASMRLSHDACFGVKMN